MGNPFSVTFGSTPVQYIPRINLREQVIQDFNSGTPTTHAYAIIGVRGSGKTVLLTEISNKIGSDWICLDINSQDDTLRSLASKLYAEKTMHKLFVKAKIDLSFAGIGLHVEESTPAFDYETAITMMLKEVRKQHKKVFITLDEVANTDNIKKFAGAFQIFIRNNLPVFLVVAGIPENIYGLMDDKLSTFLYRTPRIEMTPLSLDMVRKTYMRSLKVDEDTALRLAVMTKGYSFAYQVLGYLCWGKTVDLDSESFEDIVNEYDYYLQEFSYIKIWNEMSANDKRLAYAIANGNRAARDIRESAGMNSKEYSVYRDRMKKKGIVDTKEYGELSFSLPRFDEFVIGRMLYE